MILDLFYGNEPLKRMLTAAIENKRLPHAILVCGDRGTGAGYLGELIAASIVCENGGCMNCTSCMKFKKGIHPDIIILDKEGENIPVKEIRALTDSARLYPNDSERKVYIIKNAHNMNGASQNALLKLLEEPPSFVSFVLTTHKSDALLNTVRSRCMSINVMPVSEDEVAQYLIKEAKQKRDAAEATAKNAAGNIGRALMLIKKSPKERDSKLRDFVLEVLYSLCFDNEFNYLRLQKRFVDLKSKSKDEHDGPAEIFNVMCELLSDAVRAGEGLDTRSFSADERLLKISQRLGAVNAARVYDAATDAADMLSRNINYSACINSFLIRTWEEIHG